MQKHFVRFYSPGTFMAEQTDKPIDDWNVAEATKMAHGIKERHGATPYGFQFVTYARGKDDLNSKQTKISPMYYLGGLIETVDEVRARKLPDERILLANMEGNGWDRVITNTNSWKITRPLDKDDVVLDWKP